MSTYSIQEEGPHTPSEECELIVVTAHSWKRLRRLREVCLSERHGKELLKSFSEERELHLRKKRNDLICRKSRKLEVVKRDGESHIADELYHALAEERLFAIVLEFLPNDRTHVVQMRVNPVQ